MTVRDCRSFFSVGNRCWHQNPPVFWSLGFLERRRLTGKPISVMLCSNGTIYDPDLARTFAIHSDSFSIAISIDGSQEIHDKHRIYAVDKGQSSWLAATATVRHLVEDGVRVSVTCVVPAPYDYIGRRWNCMLLGSSGSRSNPSFRTYTVFRKT